MARILKDGLPASSYLVVGDPTKDTTWHLKVKDADGKPDHGLMGGAWAALHEGYRGQKYEGADKAAALAKLTALYKAEGMETPGSQQAAEPKDTAGGEEDDTAQGMDEPSIGDTHVPVPLGAAKKPHFLSKLRDLVTGSVKDKGGITADEFQAHVRAARAYAGGKGNARQAAETTAAPPDDFEPCAACLAGNDDDCTCPGCAADQDCWCDQAMADDDESGEGSTQAREAAISSTGERFRIFQPVTYAEAPEWIPYLPKPGSFKHARYGELTFTRARNTDFVKKFNAGVYQTDGNGVPHIPIDAEHETKLSGAVGWINKLRLNEDGSVDARVDWTDRGRTLLAQNRFKFFSPEIYDTWPDPLSDKTITNVAIGGALTTRPFFKTNAQGVALRPLVASERGWSAFEDSSQPVPLPGAGGADAPGGQGGRMSTAVQLTEEQVKRFQEMEAENTSLRQMAETAAATAKQANERAAALELSARRQRFAEQAAHWHGPIAEKVSFMETLSEEQLKFYAQEQDGLAAQLKDSILMREIGRSGANADGSADAKLRGIAQTFREKDPMLSKEQAYAKALDANPELYERSLSE